MILVSPNCLYILGDMSPRIGSLTRSPSRRSTRQSLVFFVTVRIYVIEVIHLLFSFLNFISTQWYVSKFSILLEKEKLLEKESQCIVFFPQCFIFYFKLLCIYVKHLSNNTYWGWERILIIYFWNKKEYDHVISMRLFITAIF